jgi:hypothetical protein
MAWAHNFKPPSGIPARGVGRGDGWGGPAKGAGYGGPAQPFTADSPTRHTGARNPKKAEARRVRSAEKATRIEQHTMHLCDLGLNAEREETQVSACIAALNRLEGKPVARSKTVATNRSLEELIQATQTSKGKGRSRA